MCVFGAERGKRKLIISVVCRAARRGEEQRKSYGDPAGPLRYPKNCPARLFRNYNNNRNDMRAYARRCAFLIARPYGAGGRGRGESAAVMWFINVTNGFIYYRRCKIFGRREVCVRKRVYPSSYRPIMPMYDEIRYARVYGLIFLSHSDFFRPNSATDNLANAPPTPFTAPSPNGRVSQLTTVLAIPARRLEFDFDLWDTSTEFRDTFVSDQCVKKNFFFNAQFYVSWDRSRPLCHNGSIEYGFEYTV